MVVLVRAGNYRETAAQAIGVSIGTVKRWLTWGRADPDGSWGAFARAVDEAEAQSEVQLVAVVRKAATATTDPARQEETRAARKASAHAQWLLERKHPKRWAARVIVSTEENLREAVAALWDAMGTDAWTREQVVSLLAGSADNAALDEPGGGEIPAAGDARTPALPSPEAVALAGAPGPADPAG